MFLLFTILLTTIINQNPKQNKKVTKSIFYIPSVKQIAILSILMALGVALKFFSIGNGQFRISFWDIPIFLSGMIGGAGYGLLVALGADLLYGLVFSSYPFSLIMTLSTIVWGIAGGIFYRKTLNKKNIVLLFIVVLITSLFATTINSIYTIIYYGFQTMLLKLPLRLVILIVKWPITSILTSTVYKLLFEKKINK